jgi:hypothetical protein
MEHALASLEILAFRRHAMTLTTQQIAEAIFEEVFADVAFKDTSIDSAFKAQADMLNHLFRYQQVTKIRRVLEKCQQ